MAQISWNSSSDRLFQYSYAQVSSLGSRFKPEPTTIKTHTQKPLLALSPSPGKDLCVVAGREILKIYSTGSHTQEILNLKKMLANDVVWVSTSTIVAGLNSGQVLVFDLQKTEKVDRTIHEHTRSVNRVSVHPTDSFMILSGSQDGTLKLWDLRIKSKSIKTFDGRSESVRDVQFHPTAHEFAAVFDNGSLQTWDLRNPNQFERKWSGHNGLALTVDWNGGLIATGGRDKMIKVWDSKSERRKPVYTIQTIAPVSRVKWRPGYSQIASCSLTNDFRIQVWDYEQPFVPRIILDEHSNVVTGLVWNDSESLWSCSKDETFVQHNIANGYSPSDYLCKNTSALNPLGSLTCCVQDSVEEETLEPRQRVVMGDVSTFDSHSFSLFAEHFKFDKSDIQGSCEWNAQVAESIGRHDNAQVWRMVINMVNDPIEPLNLTEKYNAQKKPVQPKKTFPFLNDDHPARDDDISDTGNTHSDSAKLTALPVDSRFVAQDSSSDTSDDEIIKPLDHLKLASPAINSEPVLKKDVMLPIFNPNELFESLVNIYIEQVCQINKGDVQMIVYLSLLFPHIPIPNLQEITEAYIDLLYRYQLWPQATKMINETEFQSIREKNSSTTFYSNCYACGHTIGVTTPTPTRCEKCKTRMTECSYWYYKLISKLPVNGIYTWCQHCCHGGHVSCMDEWFSECKECPTGCGHICTI